MPLPADLLDLFAYNRWANARTLEAVQPLGPEQYGRELGGSFPSLRDTLHHLLLAEWLWLQRWQGTSPTAPPAGWDVSTPVALRTQWQQVEAEQTAFLTQISAVDLPRVVTYTLRNGKTGAMPLHYLLRHALNHSTYHRGQVATLLRQLGASANSTDLLEFYDLRRLEQ